MSMSKEPPLKRARGCVAAARAAVQNALGASDASKLTGALRAVLECKAELQGSLSSLVDLHLQTKALELLESQVREEEQRLREHVVKLSAAEQRLLELEIQACGSISPLFGPDAAPRSSTTLLVPASLRDLVLLAQQVSYSTAAPPLTPAGAISLMPLAATMRMSTLYNPVARLSDAKHEQVVRPPPAPAKPVVVAAAAAAAAPPPSQAMPDNLDLDLEDSADESSSDESSSSAASSSSSAAAEDNDDVW